MISCDGREKFKYQRITMTALIGARLFLDKFQVIPIIIECQGTNKEVLSLFLLDNSSSEMRLPTVDSVYMIAFLDLSIGSHLSLTLFEGDLVFIVILCWIMNKVVCIINLKQIY